MKTYINMALEGALSDVSGDNTVSKDSEVSIDDVKELLVFFSKFNYRARENNNLVLNNEAGELCNSYPYKIVIPEWELDPGELEKSGENNRDIFQNLTDEDSNGRVNHYKKSPLVFSSTPSNFVSYVPGLRSSDQENSSLTFSAIVSRGSEASAVYRQRDYLSGTLDSQKSENCDDSSRLRELISKARVARCRARFPVPVILYKDNYICRSSTLSGGPEMYSRSGLDYLFATGPSRIDQDDEDELLTGSDRQLFDKVRAMDIKLLKTYNTGVITDLMVENKKVKFGLNVTSSEKVDKENRYNEFAIISLPYPGCEFFKEFRDLNYNAEGLKFNWNQAFVDAQLLIPERTISSKVVSDWNSYRKWDLIHLTQNYLRLLLAYVNEGQAGILIHCISGWDRTPLFISLLRLSLWADGFIHANLDYAQILYLTIAYDWFLFGHNLQDRLAKGEEIFFFCFYFLKHMMSDDFNVLRKRHVSSESVSSDRVDSCFPLDCDSLSSASSSNSINSLTSGYASNRYFKTCRTTGTDCGTEAFYNSHLTWPYKNISYEDIDPAELCSLSHSSCRKGSCSRISSTVSSEKNRECAEIASAILSDRTLRKEAVISAVSSNHSPFSLVKKPKANSDSSGDSDTSDSKYHSDSYDSSFLCPESFPYTSTAPVAVPLPRGNRMSPKCKPDSSGSIGSWQIITGTGSLRGSTGSNNLGSSTSRSSRSSLVHDLAESGSTIKEELSKSDQSFIVFNRVERLNQVRSLFYNVYATAIGFEKQESGITNLVSNLAQKVGIRQVPRIYT